MRRLNRFERVASDISKRHAVPVKWVGSAYVVDGQSAGDARKAERAARKLARAAKHRVPATPDRSDSDMAASHLPQVL